MAAKQKPARKKKVEPILDDQIAVVSLVDRFSTYPSKGLSPGKLASLLREADDGNVLRQMELFEEMLEKDGHLQALFQARRLAVTRRNYTIIPASQLEKDVLIAKEIDQMIKRIRGWRSALSDMLDCVPKGFAVNELMWTMNDDRMVLGGIKYRHPKKFRFGKLSDPYADPEELRLIVDPQHVGRLRGLVPDSELASPSTDGISLMADPRIRQKFVVTFCKARSGHPARTSLLRTLTYLYLFKNYDIKWWIQFAEVLLGYRIGKYDPSQPDQKELLLRALRGLATDSAAVISKDSEIEFKEMLQKASSHQVYSDVKDWANSEMSEVVLGHTGTTTGTPGKLGQEDMAREVKQELVEADAQIVDESISDDIIRVYVDHNHGDQDEYPYYQTDLSQALDLREEIAVDRALQDAGFPLGLKYMQEKYGRPPFNPKDPEDRLLVPVRENLFGPPDPSAIAAKKKLLTKR